MKYIFIVISLFIYNSCKQELFEDDKLTLEKTNYKGNELRIDGYYYMISEDSMSIISSYFFYRDGTLLHGGGWPYSTNLKELEKSFKPYIRDNSQLRWGIFRIEKNKISFERWYPSSSWSLPAYVRSGFILNDTTFIINNSKRSDGSGEWELREVYHFKEFAPKPDSTNSFV